MVQLELEDIQQIFLECLEQELEFILTNYNADAEDIFDKLDEHRVSQIIELVNNDEFGQIFITDTHSDRIEKVIQRSNKSYQIFKM